jgi:hypothetical protein
MTVAMLLHNTILAAERARPGLLSKKTGRACAFIPDTTASH